MDFDKCKPALSFSTTQKLSRQGAIPGRRPLNAEDDTMRGITIGQELERMRFARKAARHFEQHPEHSSYGDIVPGAFLALRWGMGEDCVLVVKLDDYDEPTNYHQIIRKQ